MTPENFCYWLQGYFEIMEAAQDDMIGNVCEARAKVIKEHLALVFKRKELEENPPISIPHGSGVTPKFDGVAFC